MNVCNKCGKGIAWTCAECTFKAAEEEALYMVSYAYRKLAEAEDELEEAKLALEELRTL